MYYSLFPLTTFVVDRKNNKSLFTNKRSNFFNSFINNRNNALKIADRINLNPLVLVKNIYIIISNLYRILLLGIKKRVYLLKEN